MQIATSLNQRAREMGFKSYNDYLKNSFYWHAFRQRQIRTTCAACNKWGNENYMELHHVNYERLGREIPEDVVTLCNFCHEQAHKLIWSNEATLQDAHLILQKWHLEIGAQLALAFDDGCNQPDSAA